MDANFYALGSRGLTTSPNGDVSMRKDWPATDHPWFLFSTRPCWCKDLIDMIVTALVIPEKVYESGQRREAMLGQRAGGRFVP